MPLACERLARRRSSPAQNARTSGSSAADDGRERAAQIRERPDRAWSIARQGRESASSVGKRQYATPPWLEQVPERWRLAEYQPSLQRAVFPSGQTDGGEIA